MIGFEIKIVFEPAGQGNGKLCDNCEKEIWGEMYQGVIQFGTADRLDMRPVKFVICEECKSNKPE